jgi:hypothetical protein
MGGQECSEIQSTIQSYRVCDDTTGADDYYCDDNEPKLNYLDTHKSNTKFKRNFLLVSKVEDPDTGFRGTRASDTTE